MSDKILVNKPDFIDETNVVWLDNVSELTDNTSKNKFYIIMNYPNSSIGMGYAYYDDGQWNILDTTYPICDLPFNLPITTFKFAIDKSHLPVIPVNSTEWYYFIKNISWNGNVTPGYAFWNGNEWIFETSKSPVSGGSGSAGVSSLNGFQGTVSIGINNTTTSINLAAQTDTTINGSSVVNAGVANIAVDGTYNASSNKIATVSSIPTTSKLNTIELLGQSKTIGINDSTKDINLTFNQTQSDWNETSDTAAGFIKNKPEVMSDVSLNGTSIVSSGTANINTQTAYDATSNKIATIADVGVSDVKIGSTSIVSSGIATIQTGTTYNPTSNKIATMADVTAPVSDVKVNGTSVVDTTTKVANIDISTKQDKINKNLMYQLQPTVVSSSEIDIQNNGYNPSTEQTINDGTMKVVLAGGLSATQGENGDITLTGGSGTGNVSSVNTKTPDTSGNVTVLASNIKTGTGASTDPTVEAAINSNTTAITDEGNRAVGVESALALEVASKQNILTAGSNITIDNTTNTISAANATVSDIKVNDNSILSNTVANLHQRASTTGKVGGFVTELNAIPILDGSTVIGLTAKQDNMDLATGQSQQYIQDLKYQDLNIARADNLTNLETTVTTNATAITTIDTNLNKFLMYQLQPTVVSSSEIDIQNNGYNPSTGETIDDGTMKVTLSGGLSATQDSTTGDITLTAPAATVQQQSDWNETDATAVDFIKNKPEVVSDISVNGTSIVSNGVANLFQRANKTDKLGGVVVELNATPILDTDGTTIIGLTAKQNNMDLTTGQEQQYSQDLKYVDLNIARASDLPAHLPVSYVTTAPTSDNTTGGYILAMLDSDPAEKYNGYLYFVNGTISDDSIYTALKTILVKSGAVNLTSDDTTHTITIDVDISGKQDKIDKSLMYQLQPEVISSTEIDIKNTGFNPSTGQTIDDGTMKVTLSGGLSATQDSTTGDITLTGGTASISIDKADKVLTEVAPGTSIDMGSLSVCDEKGDVIGTSGANSSSFTFKGIETWTLGHLSAITTSVNVVSDFSSPIYFGIGVINNTSGTATLVGVEMQASATAGSTISYTASASDLATLNTQIDTGTDTSTYKVIPMITTTTDINAIIDSTAPICTLGYNSTVDLSYLDANGGLLANITFKTDTYTVGNFTVYGKDDGTGQEKDIVLFEYRLPDSVVKSTSANFNVFGYDTSTSSLDFLIVDGNKINLYNVVFDLNGYNASTASQVGDWSIYGTDGTASPIITWTQSTQTLYFSKAQTAIDDISGNTSFILISNGVISTSVSNKDSNGRIIIGNFNFGQMLNINNVSNFKAFFTTAVTLPPVLMEAYVWNSATRDYIYTRYLLNKYFENEIGIVKNQGWIALGDLTNKNMYCYEIDGTNTVVTGGDLIYDVTKNQTSIELGSASTNAGNRIVISTAISIAVGATISESSIIKYLTVEVDETYSKIKDILTAGTDITISFDDTAHTATINNTYTFSAYAGPFAATSDITSPDTAHLYLVGTTSPFEMYIYNGTTFEDVGAASVDLTNYIEKSSTTGLIKNDGTIDTTSYATTASLATKQDVVSGSSSIDISSNVLSAKVSTTSGNVISTQSDGLYVNGTSFQPTLTTGAGIDITSNTISAKYDGTTIDANTDGKLYVVGGTVTDVKNGNGTSIVSGTVATLPLTESSFSDTDTNSAGLTITTNDGLSTIHTTNTTSANYFSFNGGNGATAGSANGATRIYGSFTKDYNLNSFNTHIAADVDLTSEFTPDGDWNNTNTKSIRIKNDVLYISIADIENNTTVGGTNVNINVGSFTLPSVYTLPMNNYRITMMDSYTSTDTGLNAWLNIETKNLMVIQFMTRAELAAGHFLEIMAAIPLIKG